ncbi:MAG: glutamate--cysteine ligase [Alphaproteobacteria bacterium]|nr:glutamate--cysteine ligase [Alphaproteobacteria bacterium]MBP9877732.1 glutamate--cysteine ligase [Alphaproteobacteria bacterium]
MIIENKHQLIDYFAGSGKPPHDWRIGTEHEKFVFDLKTLRPVPYAGDNGIEAILTAFSTQFGWSPVFEKDKIIALKRGQAMISLEPAGQLELSGSPLLNIHQTCQETHDHLDQAREICCQLGLGLLGMGLLPKWDRDDMPWMPKGRYKIMREYMPKKGTLGLDMMTRTSTIQANLDYLDEKDMVRKFRVSLALQPIVTALFANSPFVNGKPSGYLSYRNHIWHHTDPDRTGFLPFVFDTDFGFERYIDYALDVPMYFVYRDGTYIDASGQSFRDFLKGQLSALPGEKPLLKDWEDHLTTLFPEVRLKKYLEMRGADGGPWRRICALPALWTGLLYSDAAFQEAEALAAQLSQDDIRLMYQNVCKTGLQTQVGKTTVLDLAKRMLSIAARGLNHRQALNFKGETEEKYLWPLWQIVEVGQTLSEEMLCKYKGPWQENIDHAYSEYAY